MVSFKTLTTMLSPLAVFLFCSTTASMGHFAKLPVQKALCCCMLDIRRRRHLVAAKPNTYEYRTVWTRYAAACYSCRAGCENLLNPTLAKADHTRISRAVLRQPWGESGCKSPQLLLCRRSSIFSPSVSLLLEFAAVDTCTR